MVRAGYKQTEVGEIPEDWGVKKLEDCISQPIQNGVFFEPARKGRGESLINVIHLYKEGVIVDDGLDKFDASATEKKRFSVQNGDLFFTRSSITPDGIAHCNVFKGKTGSTVLFECHLIRARLKKETANPFFLQKYLVSRLARRYFVASAKHTTMTTIDQNAVNNVYLPIPNTDEQKEIAKALSDVDELIVSLEKLIAKKRDIQTGTMQQLLTGKKRLAGFGEGKGYKQTELGEIPEDWDLLKFSELREPNDVWSITGGPFGSNLKSSDYTETGVRIIQLQNIGDGSFLNDYEIFTSLEKANELRSCNIYPGEIILSKMGDPVARACLIPDFHERYVMCSDGIRLKVDPKRHNTYFIFLLINFRIFRSQAMAASTGSTRQRIGLTELKELKLFCPLQNEQEKISDIVLNMDQELANLNSKLNTTKAIKQGMMQELLTGRTRLI